MSTSALSLGRKEFVFIAALMNEAVVIGVEDPFVGCLAEQVLEEWEKVSPAMIQQGYIHINDVGVYEVKPELKDIILSCCQPIVWVSVTKSDSEKESTTQVLNFSGEGNCVVEISSTLEEGIIEVRSKSYQGDKATKILEFIGLRSSNESEGIHFTMSDKVYASLKMDNALLDEDNKNVTDEIRLFGEVVRTASIRMLVNIGAMSSGDIALRSFGVLQGDDRNWSVEYLNEQNSKMILVTDCGESYLSKKVNQILEELKVD